MIARLASRRLLLLIATWYTHQSILTGMAEDLSLPDTRLTLQSTSAAISLDPLFRTKRDGAQPLRFEILETSDPNSVLSNIELKGSSLRVRSFSRGTGTASVTVRAVPAEPFNVYDNISGTIGVDKPDTIKAGMMPAQILTHYAFFTYDPVTKKYDESKINEAQLRWVAQNHINDDHMTVLNIESPAYFGNTSTGRDNLARVLSIIRSVRPSVKALGYYMLLPERRWWEPVRYRRALRDSSLGISTTYSLNREQFEKEYSSWLSRNSWYRSKELTTYGGGGTLAEKVSATYPSLYTLFRDAPSGWGALVRIWGDTDSNTLLARSCGFQNGSIVRLVPSKGIRSSGGLSRTALYHVVNSSANNLRFQLSKTPGGKPVTIRSEFKRKTYLVRVNQGRKLCQDEDVVDWSTYAIENILEARKFGKPVYPYLSPTLQGAGEVNIDGQFWRTQLEIVREFADGVVIWDGINKNPRDRANTQWWKETEAFLASLKPRTMKITITK